MVKEIKFKPGDDLEDAVYQLLDAKARGEQVYGKFNGHIFYSDTVTMDSAYMEIFGHTKEENDRIIAEDLEGRLASLMDHYTEEANLKAAELEKSKVFLQKNKDDSMHSSQMVDATRIQGQDVIITNSIVINGLKFITENQTLTQEELIKGLLELGCNFTHEDIKKQFACDIGLYDGLKKGDIACGASVIAHMRDSEFIREDLTEKLLSYDDEMSIYHFIRIATGDPNYTKAKLDASKGTSERGR